MANEEPNLKDLKVDGTNLYREETITDLRVATLRKLVPIKVDGSPDTSRPALFSAETQVMSQMGPVPIHCPLEAKTLEEAIQKFPAAIEEAIEKIIHEAREMRRREASRIVVPGSLPPGGIGGIPGVGGAGKPSGRIELG